MRPRIATAVVAAEHDLQRLSICETLLIDGVIVRGPDGDAPCDVVDLIHQKAKISRKR